MRTLKGINLVHDDNYLLNPQGAIQNETDSQEGTPVVREVYNDLLMNVYAILKDRKIPYNQQEDNEQNGYQLLDALRLLTNELNDTEKVLNNNGSTWNIDLNFALVPNKYFVFARAAENYSSSIQFIKGSGTQQFPFQSNQFKTGDEILIILDQGTVRAYNLSSSGSSGSNNSLALFGMPLRYSENKENIWYEDSGTIYNSKPKSYDLEAKIRAATGVQLVVLEIFVVQGRAVCLTYDESRFEYRFFYFVSEPFLVPIELLGEGLILNQNNTADRHVHIYFDGLKLYVSNNGNTDDDDKKLACFSINFQSNRLVYSTTYNLEPFFYKTTNSIVLGGGIVNFANNAITYFPFNGGSRTSISENEFKGMIFKIGTNVYFSNTDNATPWEIDLQV